MTDSLLDLFKHAKQMQSELARKQKALEDVEFTGEAGAGLITIKINGRYSVKQINIDDSVLLEDKEVLEELLTAAINNAVKKVDESNNVSMAELATNFKLPDDFKFPF